MFLTFVSVFNGAFPRWFKEALVFWPAPRPGSRAFSHFMLRDSTIDRHALQTHFAPFPSDPDEQNALWAGWLNEFEDDARVRPAYGHYLFARDWTAIAVATLVLAGPLALWLAADVGRALAYGVVLLCQCAIAPLDRSCSGRAIGHVGPVVQGVVAGSALGRREEQQARLR